MKLIAETLADKQDALRSVILFGMLSNEINSILRYEQEAGKTFFTSKGMGELSAFASRFTKLCSEVVLELPKEERQATPPPREEWEEQAPSLQDIPKEWEEEARQLERQAPVPRRQRQAPRQRQQARPTPRPQEVPKRVQRQAPPQEVPSIDDVIKSLYPEQDTGQNPFAI